jgi:hypothetical protein
MLVPPPEDEPTRSEEEQARIARVVEEMLAWRDREGPKLNHATIRELMEEGRR